MMMTEVHMKHQFFSKNGFCSFYSRATAITLLKYAYVILCDNKRSITYHRCKKTLTPRIKNIKNAFFMKENFKR